MAIQILHNATIHTLNVPVNLAVLTCTTKLPNLIPRPIFYCNIQHLPMNQSRRGLEDVTRSVQLRPVIQLIAGVCVECIPYGSACSNLKCTTFC